MVQNFNTIPKTINRMNQVFLFGINMQMPTFEVHSAMSLLTDIRGRTIRQKQCQIKKKNLTNEEALVLVSPAAMYSYSSSDNLNLNNFLCSYNIGTSSSSILDHSKVLAGKLYTHGL